MVLLVVSAWLFLSNLAGLENSTRNQEKVKGDNNPSVQWKRNPNAQMRSKESNSGPGRAIKRISKAWEKANASSPGKPKMPKYVYVKYLKRMPPPQKSAKRPEDCNLMAVGGSPGNSLGELLFTYTTAKLAAAAKPRKIVPCIKKVC